MAFPVGDAIGAAILIGAGLYDLYNALNESGDLTGDVGKISDKTGLSPKEIRDRIHKAKKNLPRGTEQRNPDCKVDTNSGEIYPQSHDGGVGDSIGNIFDN